MREPRSWYWGCPGAHLLRVGLGTLEVIVGLVVLFVRSSVGPGWCRPVVPPVRMAYCVPRRGSKAKESRRRLECAFLTSSVARPLSVVLWTRAGTEVDVLSPPPALCVHDDRTGLPLPSP